MQRIFTQTMGNFKKGDIREYPIGTWKSIEKSAGKDMGNFSKVVDDAALQGIDVVENDLDSHEDTFQRIRKNRKLRLSAED